MTSVWLVIADHEVVGAYASEGSAKKLVEHFLSFGDKSKSYSYCKVPYSY